MGVIINVVIDIVFAFEQNKASIQDSIFLSRCFCFVLFYFQILKNYVRKCYSVSFTFLTCRRPTAHTSRNVSTASKDDTNLYENPAHHSKQRVSPTPDLLVDTLRVSQQLPLPQSNGQDDDNDYEELGDDEVPSPAGEGRKEDEHSFHILAGSFSNLDVTDNHSYYIVHPNAHSTSGSDLNCSQLYLDSMAATDPTTSNNKESQVQEPEAEAKIDNAYDELKRPWPPVEGDASHLYQTLDNPTNLQSQTATSGNADEDPDYQVLDSGEESGGEQTLTLYDEKEYNSLNFVPITSRRDNRDKPGDASADARGSNRANEYGVLSSGVERASHSPPNSKNIVVGSHKHNGFLAPPTLSHSLQKNISGSKESLYHDYQDLDDISPTEIHGNVLPGWSKA